MGTGPDAGLDAGLSPRGPEQAARAAAEPEETSAAITEPTRGRRWSALIREALPRLGRAVATAAVTCLPVGVIATFVIRGWPPLIDADNRAIRAATDITRERPALFDALIAWQEVFLPWHVYVAAIPFVYVVWRAGLRAHAIWGTATMLIGWNLGLQVKLIVQRTRPEYDDPVSSAPGFSFPSGHAFNVAMATTTVLIMCWPLLRERSAAVRAGAVTFGAALVVLTALDRVFLGVHFPSDVTAGALLALGLAFASWIGFSHGRPAPEPRRQHGVGGNGRASQPHTSGGPHPSDGSSTAQPRRP